MPITGTPSGGGNRPFGSVETLGAPGTGFGVHDANAIESKPCCELDEKGTEFLRDKFLDEELVDVLFFFLRSKSRFLVRMIPPTSLTTLKVFL